MEMKDKIRFYGARRKLTFLRIGLFTGMMYLFALILGVEFTFFAALLWAGLCVGIVFLFFASRGERVSHREQQISTEVIELFPNETRDNLYNAFMRRRQREMRLEALQYLGFSLLFAFWCFLLYLIEADAITWFFGMLIVPPALLLIALALFVASVIRWKKVDAPTIDAYLLDPELQRIMRERRVRPDRRWVDAPRIWEKNEKVTREEIAQELKDKRKKTSFGWVLLIIVSIGFFVVIPTLGTLIALLMSVVLHENYWLPFLFGALAIPIDVAGIILLNLGKQAKKARKAAERGNFTVQYDKVLSSIPDESKAYRFEVCFDRMGTVRLTDKEWAKKLEEDPTRDALLVIAQELVTEVIFLEHGEAAESSEERAAVLKAAAPEVVQKLSEENIAAAAPMPAPAPAPAPAEIPAPAAESLETAENPYPGDLLSDEAIHEEAVRRAAAMDPAKRMQFEKEINEYLDCYNLSREKGITNLTKREHEEYSNAMANNIHRKAPDLQFLALEEHLMDKLKATRPEIASMKRNPFLKDFFLWLGLTVLVGVGGAVAIALIRKATGWEIGWTYMIVSAAGGLLALKTANALLTVFRFRKLQRAYRKGNYREQLIEAETYKVIEEQVKQQRGEI